jgi:pimeloyl-ACP methyl ester carboxylesterase
VNIVERGSGTPIVLLHGLGVDHRILLPLDDAIASAGDWRRLYVDMPGHGTSPIGNVASTEDVVREVAREVGERLGEERFAILGASFGAMVARCIARDMPGSTLGLATLGGVFIAEHHLRRVPDRVVLHEDPDALVAAGEAREEYLEMAVVQSTEGARDFLEYAHPGVLAADQRAPDLISSRYSPDRDPEGDTAPPYPYPALFVTGRQDHVVGYEDAYSRLDHYPRATYAALDATGHNVHLDQPAVTAALLTGWLGRIRAMASRAKGIAR